MYFNRTIETTLRTLGEMFPVMLLTGPRQVGKTTLLTKMADGRRNIVSLDNPEDVFTGYVPAWVI